MAPFMTLSAAEKADSVVATVLVIAVVVIVLAAWLSPDAHSHLQQSAIALAVLAAGLMLSVATSMSK